jgi:tRNA A-37 threonylcarbamoyl transferase component Bud32
MTTAQQPYRAPKPTTLPRITDPRLIAGFRVLWMALALLAVAMIATSVPFYVQDCGCPPDVVQVWEEVGIAAAVRIVFTAWSSIVAALLLMLSALIVWRRPDEPIAMLTAVFFVVYSTTLFTSPLARSTIPLVDDLYTALNGIALFVLPLWIHVFPTGRFVFGWIKWVFAALLVLAMSAAFLPVLRFPYIYTSIAIGLLGLAAQFYRYRRLATPTERQQLKWLLLALSGLAVYVLTFLIIELTAIQTTTRAIGHALMGNVSFMAWLGLGLAVAFAILRRGLWDVDLVINRSIVYVTLALMVLVMFFAALTALQVTLGQTQPLLAAAIAAGFAAAIFQPVRKRIQAFVDERIFGLRFNQNELQKAQQRKPITRPGFLTGQVIEGYEVGELLGQGGMGEVYRATKQGQTVAIKTMLQKFAGDTDRLERFQREATISRQIEHSNIARSLSSGVHEGTPYIIMEYVEGESLADVLASEGTLAASTVLQITDDVCAALAVAHQQKLVHRDLKPGNIMIRPTGQAVVLDFGIAKVSQASRNLTGSDVIGTIDYMAPEQIKASAQVDARADIYALGVIAYQMFTGKTPFEGGLAQVMFAHLQKPAPDPRQDARSVPDHMAGAILRAMAKQPDQRFATVTDFLHAMQGSL